MSKKSFCHTPRTSPLKVAYVDTKLSSLLPLRFFLFFFKICLYQNPTLGKNKANSYFHRFFLFYDQFIQKLNKISKTPSREKKNKSLYLIRQQNKAENICNFGHFYVYNALFGYFLIFMFVLYSTSLELVSSHLFFPTHLQCLVFIHY